MNYEDFVWFCLCEEDKTSLRSLDYWFRCLDTDEDGILSGYELDYFFSEQRQRMEAAYQETISYDDILCQMMDMISPSRTDGLRLSDLKACTLSGNFFNALFNLQKFIAFEQRDPFIAHAEKQLPEKTYGTLSHLQCRFD
ncbi:putative serine/threonine protein phosphatase 2A regulatory subunit Bprimeprimegamma [Diplonema papillatum]|nr:putative serine/threonine protein phosphatase 2A regulatory subunit Bprimeprimegamma [Diplonema papillatum]